MKLRSRPAVNLSGASRPAFRLFFFATVTVALVLLHLARAGAAPQQPAAASIAQAAKQPQNWLTFFGNYQAWSYSSARSHQPRKCKTRRAGVGLFHRRTFGPAIGAAYCRRRALLGRPDDNLFALDAATGKQLWKYSFKRPSGPDVRPAGNRATGISIGYGMIFMGTNNDHLVAVDAKTGQESWNIEVEDPVKCGCGINSAPLLVKDKIIVGGTGGERAHRGYLSAYDARTGKLDWRFYTIPAPGEPGSETWSGDSWKYGGGTTWFSGSYDPALNLIYWGVGNPSSDFYGDERPGAKPVHRFADRSGCRHRKTEMVFPGNSARSQRLRFQSRAGVV